MMKQCVVLNDQVINIGPWDYQMQPFEVSPEERDAEGSLVKEAEYEDRPTNPLPEGAEVVEMEIVEGPDGGLYPADRLPGLSEMDKLTEQLVQREIEALELKSENQMLGEQLVAMELRLLALEGGTGE